MKNILVIADPIERWSPVRETTFCLLEEATRRRYRVFVAELKDLGYWDQKIRTICRPVQVLPKNLLDPFQYEWLGDSQEKICKDFDLILLRKDPPLDMAYFQHMQLLANLESSVRFCNRPSSVMKWNEKLAILGFPKFISPSVVGIPGSKPLQHFSGLPMIRKTLNDAAGRSVRLVETDSELITANASEGRDFVMDQAFNPKIREGDKRVLLVDGKVGGQLLRVPKDGSFLSNIRAGGTPMPCKLSRREMEICKQIGKWAKKEKMFWVGLDIIGECLSEINFTSVMGIIEVRQVGGPDLAPVFWNRIWISKLV